jgi:peptide/nickel transport system substrate-binding protein
VRATIKHLVLPYGEVWVRLAEYIRQSLRQVGIAVELESTDAGAWARRVGSWEYETSINFLYQFGDPTLGVERTYVSSNIQRVLFANTGGYSNPQVDALFQRARESGVEAERRTAFSEVQKILADDMPQIWLMEMSFPSIFDRRLNNVITTGTGPNSSFDDVFLAS